MKKNLIALDLGGAEIKVVDSERGCVLSEPTLVVGYENKVYYGISAQKIYEQFGDDCERFAPIYAGVVQKKEYAVKLIKHCLNRAGIVEDFVERAVVCIPCGLTGYDKEQLEQTLIEAGICRVDFVLIGQVAVVAGLKCVSGKTKMFVDIGSSKTDISVLTHGDIVKGCTISVGTDMMDEAIVNFVEKAYSIIINDSIASKIRTSVGSLFNYDGASTNFTGISVNGTKLASNTVFAKDLKMVIEPFYKNIHTAIETILNMCDEEVIVDLWKNGIVVIGGGAMVSGLSEYLNKKLKLNIIIPEKPQNVIIEGLKNIVKN